MRHYNIPIFIPHLGCPYDCIFCDQKKISAQQQVPGSAEIVAIIEQHLRTIPDPAEVELAFFGGSFTAIQNELQQEYLSIVQPYLKSGRIQGIRISTRPDCITAEGLEMLKHYGVKTIELGVQSLNDEVLRSAGRRYKAENVYQSAALIHERGFQLGIQLMIGLPGDHYERDIQTVKDTIRLAPQMVRIYPTLVIAGTALESLWQDGQYQALTLEEAITICQDMLLHFTAADIPVIRMGLYPGEELLNGGVIKAGPFHPAFGELVEQAIFREQAMMAIKLHAQRFGKAENLYLYVNERDLSKMLGQQRKNLAALRQTLGLRDLRVKTCHDDLRNWIRVSSSEAEVDFISLTRMDFIKGLQNRSI